jgi:hypothetical protein
MPDDAALFGRASDVLSTPLGGEWVLLNLKDGTYYGLDGVGAAIWKLLQTPVAVEEICRTICNTYDVAADRCAVDVADLLTELERRGLVEVRR